MDQKLIETHARRFTWRAENIYSSKSEENSSRLYAYLSAQVANDPEIIQLVVGADAHTTVANLFFGAVHYLLLGGIEDLLAAFYPSLTDSPRPPREAYPSFHAFCLNHASDIQELVSTRTVQTNEVRRCTALLPGFQYLSQRLNGEPLQLVEVGASAGLNLLWDDYSYDYGSVGQLRSEPSAADMRRARRDSASNSARNACH